MTIYNLKTRQMLDGITPDANDEAIYAIFCSAVEAEDLRKIYGWDISTTTEYMHLDEIVRYTSYNGYDFISLIHTDAKEDNVVQREINVVLAKSYLVLVLPQDKGDWLPKLAYHLQKELEDGKITTLSWLYYSIFNELAANFSQTLELLEDKMEALSEAIPLGSKPCQFRQIEQLRKAAYTHKKLLRALSYTGAQILMDENHLLDNAHIHYFRNINTRLIKLCDFAENLYTLSGELLHLYDSRSSVRLNENMAKLTVITLFFGPLTVITGIYGMNFVNMPELSWFFGYPIALGIMAVVSMVIYFIIRKKKWL